MKSIFKNFSYVLLANLINALSKFLVIVLIVNILAEYELGVYTFALALSAPITLLFNMKMRSYIIASDNINYFQFLKLRNLANIFALLFIISITLLFYRDIYLVIVLVASMKIIDINSEFYQSFPNKEKMFEKPAKLMIIRIICSTIIFFVVIKMTNSLVYGLLAQLLFLIVYIIIEKNINLSLVDYKKYNYSIRIKDLFILLLPLGIVQFLMSFSSNIPKYILEFNESYESIGILSAILYIVTIFNLLMTTLTQTFLPYLKNVFSSNFKKFNSIVNVWINLIALVIGMLFLLFSYFIGDKMLSIIFTSEFSEYTYLLYIFSFVIVFNISGWVYDSSLLLVGAIKFQPYILIIITILTSIIGIVLISNHGLLGAGITVLIFNLLNTFSKAIYYNIKVRR